MSPCGEPLGIRARLDFLSLEFQSWNMYFLMWLMPFEDIINVRTVSFMIPSMYVFLYFSSIPYFLSKRVHFDWRNPSPAGLNFSVEVGTSIPCACLRWHWNLKIQWDEITHLESAVLYHVRQSVQTIGWKRKGRKAVSHSPECVFHAPKWMDNYHHSKW